MAGAWFGIMGAEERFSVGCIRRNLQWTVKRKNETEKNGENKLKKIRAGEEDRNTEASNQAHKYRRNNWEAPVVFILGIGHNGS